MPLSTKAAGGRQSRPSRRERYRYVYGVIQSRKEQSFGKIGIQDRDVYTVHYKDLAAVVSDASKQEYEILDYGTTHQKVVEEVSRAWCIVPMGFGQVTTESDLKTFLVHHYAALIGMRKKVEGNVELGVKAFWQMDRVLQSLAAQDDGIRILQGQISRRPEKETYRLRIRLGQRVASGLEGQRKAISTAMHRKLAKLAVDARINKNVTDQMIFNASYLVDVNREQEFDAGVEALEAEFGDQVTMNYFRSPAYSFANLHIGR